MDINNGIGARMLARLNAISKTQAELAEYLGVTQASVSNWINGVKVPRMNKIDKICTFLRCSRSELLIGDPIQSGFNVDNAEILWYLKKNPLLKEICFCFMELEPAQQNSILIITEGMLDKDKLLEIRKKVFGDTEDI